MLAQQGNAVIKMRFTDRARHAQRQLLLITIKGGWLLRDQCIWRNLMDRCCNPSVKRTNIKVLAVFLFPDRSKVARLQQSRFAVHNIPNAESTPYVFCTRCPEPIRYDGFVFRCKP